MSRLSSFIAASSTLAAVLALGGCGTVQELAGVPLAGPQANGGYILTSSEAGMDCRSLAERIEITLEDMSKAAARIPEEKKELPPTMASVFQRAIGGPDGGLTNARKHREGEMHVRALAAEQSRKGCASADLEARIVATRPQSI